MMAVAGVLCLLTLFLGLQYRWLSEASEAERERMQKRVDADTARFAEDFNHEIQAAYYNFQTDAETWERADWREFNERYDYWRSRTAYPELIREIYFVGRAGNLEPLRYNAETRVFDVAGPDPNLDRLRSRFVDVKESRPVLEDAYALVLPIFEEERHPINHIVLRRSAGPPPQRHRELIGIPEKFGWLVILLDENVVTGRVLPDLAARHFPANDYALAVVDRNGQTVFKTGDVTGDPDARGALFNLSPDRFLFFANRELLPKATGERKDIIVNQRVESHTFTTRTETAGQNGETVKVEVQGPPGAGRTRTAMIAGTGENSDPWTLNVRHAAGSIDAFVRGERNQSFLIGLGIYLLLVGGIAAILLSAIRSKRFAQRQIDFVSSVSHEFRTPLAVIYSAGENLADGVATDEGQVSRYGELIKGEGKKLSGMVEQILEFAGASSGRRSFTFQQTSVVKVLDDALTECRPLIESSGFTVETEIADGLPQISADRSALSSAVQNLIANSVKYSNGSKWIRVSATNGGGKVKISVEDRGIGIRADDLRLIFEPFYRAKDVVDAQISGNGLGLNLVKKIVEAHGGSVSAVSKPDFGSTFTIEIPQKQ